MKRIKTTDSEEMRRLLLEREPFTTHGALWAYRSGAVFSPGWLPEEYHPSYRASEYAVYSYHTPIVWYGPDGWHFPDVAYNATTAKHKHALAFVHKWIKEDSL